MFILTVKTWEQEVRQNILPCSSPKDWRRPISNKQDVINHLRNPTGKQARKSKRTYFASWVNYVDDTAQAVLDLWNQEGMPVISFDQIRRRVKQCFQRFQLIDKLPKAKRDSDSLPGHHKASLSNLFDIDRCRCKTVTACRCPSPDRVPECEREFLEDQRGPPHMVIELIGRTVTLRRQTREERRQSR